MSFYGSDDARQLRNRGVEDRDDLSRYISGRQSAATALVAVTVKVATYPTTANKAYAVKWATVTCDEAEGASPSIKASSDPFYAVNLGASVPPVGTYVKLIQQDGLYVFIYD